MIKLILQQTLLPVGEQFSKDDLLFIAKTIGSLVAQKKEGEIAIAMIDDQEIQRLNRMYRGIDKETDVLSFGYADASHAKNSLGDVVISYPQAVRQAIGNTRGELLRLMIHGILHVLGFDHERPEDARQMFPLEDQLFSQLSSLV
ncbi:MAG: rRNA maturation RNase YbeY [Patescibacteria group bacterium]|jgi:probable rRNA maturation factor